MRIKLEMKTLTAGLLIVGIFGGGSFLGQSTAPSSLVRLHGLVKDNAGSLVQRAKISFEGEGKVWDTYTTPEGAYELNLPPGRYHVKVEADWFCTIRRPSFGATFGTPIMFDFSLQNCPRAISASIVNGQYKEMEAPVPPFKEEIVLLKKLAPFELLVHFGKQTKHRKSGLIRYDMAINGQGDPVPVVVMYDLLTVKANKVVLDSRNGGLTAKGNVFIYENEYMDFGASAQIHFKNGRPVVTVMH